MTNYNKARICKNCNGVGKFSYDVSMSGFIVPKREDCKDCNGVGEFREWVDDRTFESELHDLITKYDLCHTTLTPEFIKQQIMRDNITTHNEPLREKHEKAYQNGYKGNSFVIYSTSDEAAEHNQGAKDRQREKGDES